MSTNHRFPTLAWVVLIVGVVAVASIVIASFFALGSNTPSNPINVERAKQSADQYVAGFNLDLRVAEIEEYSYNFYVRVQERSTGINAFELLVDKSTGVVTREPGPDMMWNTKYGMMGGFGQAPTADMPVSPEKAIEYAQKWLDTNIPNAKAEDPDTFYGYYTIDVSMNNSTYGMLSVNGYSGDVWYHTWHGQFITSVEYS